MFCAQPVRVRRSSTLYDLCSRRSSQGSCAVWTFQSGSVRWWHHGISPTPMTSDTWRCGSQRFWYTRCRLYIGNNHIKRMLLACYLLIYIPAGWTRKPCTERTDLPLQQHRLLLPSIKSWSLAGKACDSHTCRHSARVVNPVLLIYNLSFRTWLALFALSPQ